MTPEQYDCFMAALNTLLIAASEGIECDGKLTRLRDAEFQSGTRLLWLGKQSNGYVNLSHDEAMALIGTSAKSTLRYHLMRLRDVGALRMYSTNGTVRAKFAAYPGSEMIAHTRTASTKTRTASTKTRTASTSDEKKDAEREQCSRDRAAGQLIRAAGSRDRAAGQHYNRNFDDYPNETNPLVSKLVRSTTTDQTDKPNLLTATLDPVEEALSVAFLKAAGFFPRTAIDLAKTHPFELLRRAVAFWWSNRRSMGGEFAETPGIVLTWLKNPDSTVIPALSNDFMGSDLFWQHLTSAERDDLDREGRNQPEPDMDEECAIDDDEPARWPEMNEYWAVALERMRAELPASTFNTWLEGSRAEFDDVALTCTIIVDSQAKTDFLNTRLRQMIVREVRKSTGYNLTVSIETRRRS